MDIANDSNVTADKDWLTLIRENPHLAQKSGWADLTTQDWAMLLHDHPEFAEKHNCPWESFHSWDWAELLDHCPQFAPKCDLTELGSDELYIIFSHQPTLIVKELIPKLGKCLIDFLVDYPEFIPEYAQLVSSESVIGHIKHWLEDEFHIWVEVQLMSMEDAYIAKAVCVDMQTANYRDIFFHKDNDTVQADADGKNIIEAVIKLYSLVIDCWRQDFLVDFDPPKR